VVPVHLPKERNLLEEPTAVVLRLQSEYMLQEWTRRLRHSAAQMRSVAAWYRSDRVRPELAKSVMMQIYAQTGTRLVKFVMKRNSIEHISRYNEVFLSLLVLRCRESHLYIQWHGYAVHVLRTSCQGLCLQTCLRLLEAKSRALT
jgi:hypothetical protein